MIAGSAVDELRLALDAQLGSRPGRFGIDLRSLDGPVLACDADTGHYAASTIKLAALPVLISGGFDRFGPVVVHDRFPSAAGGTFRLRREDDQDEDTWSRLGSPVAVEALAERMIVDSGNLATDLLLELVGLAEVGRFLRDAALAGAIQVDRLIGDSRAEGAGVTNTVSAAGLATLMAGLADASLLCAAESELALALLSRQAHLRMIPAGLPASTWSASKGGWVAGVKHDVALVRPESAPPYVLAVCTTSDLPDPDGERLVARLSRITWEHWTKWHA